MKHLFAALVIVAAAAPLRADLPDGNWRLGQMNNATADFPVCLFKVEKKDGKPAAEVADRPAKSEVKLDTFEAKGDRVLIVVDFGGTKRTFEGMVDAKDPKTVRGTFGDDMRV